MDSDTISLETSSSLPNSWVYDVFLSKHSRCSFADHLHGCLTHRGIDTFFDDEPSRGDKISPSVLKKAIGESRVSVIIFSEDYASSERCLDELVNILHFRKSKQQIVRPVFYKVDCLDVGKQQGRFGEAFAKYAYKFKDDMDMEKVQRWRNALIEAASLPGWSYCGRNEFKFIQTIIEELSENFKHHHIADLPIGIERRMWEMGKLLGTGEDDVRMIGIWGVGGIGKTAIAKAIYHSMSNKFDGACFLADVRRLSKYNIVELQRTLLVNISRNTLEVGNVDNAHEGITVIKKRLVHKKVLIVLDDVDDLKQLDMLAGSTDWFGLGSRIIITTRNRHLLTVHQVKVDHIYKVRELGPDEALELFSLTAFKEYTVPDKYAKVAAAAVDYCQSLPLALRVLGSYLYGRNIDVWEFTVESYKKVPNRKIHDVLQMSFDALEDHTKEVFLDIACFFNGEDRDIVLKILKRFHHSLEYDIHVLIENALIEIKENCIWMNKLIELMGKEIVRLESPDTPGQRSRLWFHDDVHTVLDNNIGTEMIKGIMIKLPEPEEIRLSAKNLSKMKNLQLFIHCNVRFSGDYIDHMLNKLTFLDWSELQRLPRSLAEQFKACLVEWIFLFISLFLEILSAAFAQLSSPSKPQYARYGMLLAVVAVLICVLELIYKGITSRIVWRRWGMLWWFHYPPPRKVLFGTLVDMYGLVGGISQCAFSAVEYVCVLRHINSPIKMSSLPATFLICVVVSKLIGDGSCTRIVENKNYPSRVKQKNRIRKGKADENIELTSIIIDKSRIGGVDEGGLMNLVLEEYEDEDEGDQDENEDGSGVNNAVRYSHEDDIEDEDEDEDEDGSGVNTGRDNNEDEDDDQDEDRNEDGSGVNTGRDSHEDEDEDDEDEDMHAVDGAAFDDVVNGGSSNHDQLRS